MKIKPCVNCGKEFVPSKKIYSYCSLECKNNFKGKFSYKEHRTKNCKICNKEFLSTKKMISFCSTECKEKNKILRSRKSIIGICPICGKEFFPSIKFTLFCSLECRKIKWKVYNKIYYGIYSRKKGVTKRGTKEYHEKMTSRTVSEESKKKSSDTMKQKYASGEMISPTLGKPGYFKDKKFTLEHRSKIGRAKEKHWNWQEGLSYEPYGVDFNEKLKNKIKELYENKCAFCGETNQICIHHIDYNKKNNDIYNLIPLCRKCHSKTNFKREEWIGICKKITELNSNYVIETNNYIN